MKKWNIGWMRLTGPIIGVSNHVLLLKLWDCMITLSDEIIKSFWTQNPNSMFNCGIWYINCRNVVCCHGLVPWLNAVNPVYGTDVRLSFYYLFRWCFVIKAGSFFLSIINNIAASSNWWGSSIIRPLSTCVKGYCFI